MRPAKFPPKADLEHLLTLPVVNPDRPSLRDRYAHLDAKRLELRARKFTTLSPVFQRANPLQVHEWPLPKDPVYPSWTRSSCQGKPEPFESGRNCLPGMKAFAEQLS